MYFYRSKAGYDEDNSHKRLSLLTTTVKTSKNALCFDLVTLTKTFTFQAENAEGNSNQKSEKGEKKRKEKKEERREKRKEKEKKEKKE